MEGMSSHSPEDSGVNGDVIVTKLGLRFGRQERVEQVVVDPAACILDQLPVDFRNREVKIVEVIQDKRVTPVPDSHSSMTRFSTAYLLACLGF